MENKEQILESLKNVNFKELTEQKPVFSEEEYAMFKKSGLTPEEINKLEDGEMLRQVIELLPDEEAGLERLAKALEAISMDKTEDNLKNLLTIAQNEPNLLVQILALAEVTEQSEE